MEETSREDIQKAEQLIKKCDECKINECINCEISWTEIVSTRRLIEDYKRVSEENEQLRTEVNSLKKENEELHKGINSLMQSRKKWKNRYYKTKKENKDLQKSEQQIYDDYQDIGKIAFEYSDEIEQQNKMIDLMAELIKDHKILVDKYCNVLTTKTIKQYFANKAKEVE